MPRQSPASFLHPANGLTYTSLMCGVAAVAAAVAGNIGTAGALLAAAAIADTFDGACARRFNRTAEQADMGAQLDSLSDACTFGIAPIVIASVLHRPSDALAASVWYFAAFVYVACAVTRLGAYNVWDRSHLGGNEFIGLPTPVAALFWSTALTVGLGSSGRTILALALAAAMIVPVRIARPSRLGLTIFLLWPVALISVHIL